MSWRPPYFADHTIARGSSGGGQQQTTQQVVLPDWLQSGAQQAVSTAETLSQQGTNPNPYESVAPLTPDQTQAYSEIQGMQGGTQPAYQTAENAATGLLSGAQPLTAAGIGADATTLMNPYTSAVVDPSVALMRQQLAQTTQGIDANAANVGAFGGSRQGVEEGTAQSQEALQAGQLAGGLLQSGYGQALTTAQGIAQANQQAGEWATGELPALATQEAGQTATEAGLLDEAGREQQGQAQAQSDLQASQWQENYNQPLSNLQILEQALTSTPYGGTTTTTGPAPNQPNKALTALGGAASGAAIGTALFPGVGTAIGAVGGGLLGFL